MSKKPASPFDDFFMPPEMLDFYNQSHREVINSPQQWWETATRLQVAGAVIYQMSDAAKQRQSLRFAEQQKARELSGVKSIETRPTQEEGQQFIRDYFEGTSMNTALMLFGMAFECLLKGILIARSRDEHWKSGKFKPPFGHYLPTAACKIFDDLERRQLELLTILSECIFWRGRYPADVQPNLSGTIVSFSSEFGDYLWYGMDSRYDDSLLLSNMFVRFENELHKEISRTKSE